MDDKYNVIGNAIFDARIREGVGCRKLARELNVKWTDIRKIELGVKVPDEDLMIALSFRLDIDASYLIIYKVITSGDRRKHGGLKDNMEI